MEMKTKTQRSYLTTSRVTLPTINIHMAKEYRDLLEGRGLLQPPKYAIELNDTSIKELVDIMLSVFTGDDNPTLLGRYSGKPQMVFYQAEHYNRVKSILTKIGVEFSEIGDGTSDGEYECEDTNTTSPYPGNRGMKKATLL